MYKELSYTDHDVDKIKGIQFCIMGPDEIRERSFAEIYKTESYNGTEPVLHGLFDPRMGVTDHNKVCVACQAQNTFCPGHFGHINLAKPVFHVQFFGIVKNLLKCVCFKCSKLLIDSESPEVKALMQKRNNRQKRWEIVYKLCQRIKRCGQVTVDGCGARQPTISKEGMLKIAFEWREAVNANGTGVAKQVLNAEDVLKILRRISDQDADILGFSKKYNRPEYMICTVLPVPPPSVRPSVRGDTGVRSEDDLTHKLLMIVKVNNNLKTKIEKGVKDQIDMLTMLLQYEVATLIDNTIPGIPQAQQRTGRPIRSLTERLKSKEGRIRGNLMGKRVDYSARSVITPDPNISIDELGVPIKIAMNLTFPEIVNKYNKSNMIELVRNGPEIYPGAKCVRKTREGRTIKLRNANLAEIELEEGDVVERHLRNGDYVLFNRQPSLHKMSMMSHRVRVMPFNTFRLNVMVTPSFNADFDGDEMNAHVPQSLQTLEELRVLSSVPTQIISPRECKPIISIVQDIVLGLYRATKDNVNITEKQLFNLMCTNPKFAGFIPLPGLENGKIKSWSGRQLLSTIIPTGVNVEMKTNQYDENKSKDSPENKRAIVSIRNGQVLSGVFDKEVYQARTKGLVHSIFNEYGPDETRIFFDNTQKIICNWLVLNGFSVGISDLVVDDTSFQEIIRNMKVEVYNIIQSIHINKFENRSTKNNNDHFEKLVNDILNQANKNVGDKGLSQIDESVNRMINMIKSKSKGNTINVAQMIGCLGQQNVDGRRIPYGFDDRTLPHYTKYDDGPESRGFVENSFIKGLTPQEFFFHAMGGREGLIDTAVQTSETGYIQRKLVKAMEDCKVNFDQSVRNASGSIIQFLYGDDGMNATKIESQHIPIIDQTNVNIMAQYNFSDTLSELNTFIDPDMLQSIKQNIRVLQPRMKKHVDQLLIDRENLIYNVFKSKMESTIMYPISFNRIINNIKGVYNSAGCDVMLNISPLDILDAIDDLCSTLYVNKQHKGNNILQILIRSYLSPKTVIMKYRLCREAFDDVVRTVKQRFYESLAHPSEMVGVVAAQSLGEPATQLTLNTFHLSGVSSASKTVRGVPRLRELLSVSKNPKTPMTKIYFTSQYSHDMKKCLELMNDIRTVRFKDIVKSSKIFFDPHADTNIPDDKPFVKNYQEFLKMDECNKDLSPWLLRMEFNKEALLQFHIKMYMVHQKLLEFYGDENVSCMFADDSADKIILRLKLVNNDTEADDMLTELKALEHNIMENIIIKGTKGIEKVSLDKEELRVYSHMSDTFEKTAEWIVYTEGSNFRDILCQPMIDAYRTTTNDVLEVYEVLGIEAARQALFNEINEVLDSVYVNYRHIALLVDVQTNKGNILSIDRHGINRGDIGPLAKCSFEETTDKLIKAGVFAEYDKINGVSANIMLGQIAPCGTGDTDILIDESKLKELNSKHQLQQTLRDELTLHEVCQLGFNFEVPVIDTTGKKVPTKNYINKLIVA